MTLKLALVAALLVALCGCVPISGPPVTPAHVLPTRNSSTICWGGWRELRCRNAQLARAERLVCPEAVLLTSVGEGSEAAPKVEEPRVIHRLQAVGLARGPEGHPTLIDRAAL